MQSGQIIAGRYLVQGVLGNGSQGETYRVFDNHQQETVALKLLSGLKVGPWHEARALTQLRDEHILPIRNADIASGIPFLVTELATHGTVLDELASGSNHGLPPALAARWTRQACQAIERTHAAGILHTDVKPENLFLDDTHSVRVGDFGLASLMDSSGLGHTSGTAETLAPEVAAAIVASQARATSVRSDVYSLGASLYWMLTGQPPFDSGGAGLPASAPQIVANVPRPVRDLAPHLSQKLGGIVTRAISGAPANRYATPGELSAALASCPAVTREWVRTNEHPSHMGCWRGTPRKGAVVLVCAEVAGSHTSIQAVKLPSNRKIGGTAFSVTNSQIPMTLRRVFKACA